MGKWKNFLKYVSMAILCIGFISCCPGHRININNFNSYVKANKATVYISITNAMLDGSVESMSGTGVAIDKGVSVNGINESLVLTAGHVCIEGIKPNVLFTEAVVMNIKGEVYYSKLVDIDENFDLCLIKIDAILPIAKLSKVEPRSGEKVSYSGYPTGMYMPGNLNYFDGYMSGKDPTGDHMYNMPVVGGASGSPVYNSNGQIVSIISAVMQDFEHMALGVGTSNIQNFINDNKDWLDK